MTFAGMAPARLADYREEVLHAQTPVENRRMRLLGRHLRRVLRLAGLTRQQFAERTGLALELIVAIENGYGRPATAQRLLRLARAAQIHS
jgi:DNA-binding XRE family transcriptional regulator